MLHQKIRRTCNNISAALLSYNYFIVHITGIIYIIHDIYMLAGTTIHIALYSCCTNHVHILATVQLYVLIVKLYRVVLQGQLHTCMWMNYICRQELYAYYQQLRNSVLHIITACISPLIMMQFYHQGFFIKHVDSRLQLPMTIVNQE